MQYRTNTIRRHKMHILNKTPSTKVRTEIFLPTLRHLIVILQTITCFLLFTGCGQKKSLTFITGGTAKSFAFWEKTIRDFKKVTGIDVNMIRSATQTEVRKQQIFIALRGRKADPDVMVMDIAWIGQLSASGWLEPLNNYAIDTAVFFSNIVMLADIYKNRIIGLPLYVDAGLLYYRKDLLEKYGYPEPPKT